MQHIEICLAGKNGASLKSYSGLGSTIADMIRIYANMVSNNKVYCFIPERENVLSVHLVFADKEAAEEMAKEFNPIPKWLSDYELTGGFFYGKPFSVLWDDEK
jgi:hypothetical protein